MLNVEHNSGPRFWKEFRIFYWKIIFGKS